MILLSDNDVLIKLSQCGLFDEFLNTFGVECSDCFITEVAPHSLYLANADKCIARRVGSALAYEQLVSFVEGCSYLSVPTEDPDLLCELFSIDNLDPGEMQLLQHADELFRAGADYSLFTGDRRALQGIHNSGAERVKCSLRGRVHCMESIVLAMIQVYGFLPISGKIVLAEQNTDRFDGVLSMAFGAGRSQEHAVHCLSSYIGNLGEYLRC